MPGILKKTIARRVTSALEESGCLVRDGGFTGVVGDLPWCCSVLFKNELERQFAIYLWTISHGGRTRRQSEYRIQTKLKAARSLSIGAGTTLLLGYYSGAEDTVGAEEGNDVSPEMEVFAAWDPLLHLRLGASSSCQVDFATLMRAHLVGFASSERKTAGGAVELVMSWRPERLARYMEAAAGGHNFADVARLTSA